MPAYSLLVGGRVVTETGYINLREGLSEESPAEGPSPAYKRVMELAGMYVEPGSRSRAEQEMSALRAGCA